jgi:hypothetical protein
MPHEFFEGKQEGWLPTEVLLKTNWFIQLPLGDKERDKEN